MERLPNPQPERLNSEVLDKINNAVSKLGSRMKWARPPQNLPEYEPLSGKKVMMIDDVAIVLENIIPDLMVATDGNTTFILYGGQDIETILEQILNEKPDALLLDYNLSDKVKGTDIAKALRIKEFGGKIVGFSSERAAIREFNQNGVDDCIGKGGISSEESVAELAKLFSQ